MVRAAETSGREPLGAAAVAIIGETAKSADTSGLYIEQQLNAQVPTGSDRYIESGLELAELCFAKYGRYHDMTILRNKVFDGQWQVAFNIYGPCLGQRSFSYTEQQYLDKLDTAALMLSS